MKIKTDNNTSSSPIFRCNLSLLIGGIFSALLIALGLIITLYSYETQKQKTLDSTEKIFELSSKHTQERLSGLVDSVRSYVTMSSALKDLGLNNAEEMTVLLPYFKQSFVSIPWMESFYVGYNDGSFYMMQAIRGNDRVREATDAPVGAAYSTKEISAETDPNRKVLFHYYDSELNFISQKSVAYKGFDPRERKWYEEAMGNNEIVISEPYLFFTTQEIGITISHLLQDG
ncbi:MAG: hypothetical protein KAR01_14325, partial [Desulfocapsa sp.]|nr:hypothetical protein [Desulfocapsa sp.]